MRTLAIALCILGCVGCSPAPVDPLFLELLKVPTDDFSGHDLLTPDERLPLEATVESLIADGFMPDFADLPYAQNQQCGKFRVPIFGTDQRFKSYDTAILNKHGNMLQRHDYRITLSVDASCVVIRAQGWRMRPVTL